MPNYAIIENGKVVNVVVADADYAASQGWTTFSGNTSIGWDYVDGQFVDNRPVVPTVAAALMQQSDVETLALVGL